MLCRSKENYPVDAVFFDGSKESINQVNELIGGNKRFTNSTVFEDVFIFPRAVGNIVVVYKNHYVVSSKIGIFVASKDVFESHYEMIGK